jgi:hypothetical protein
MDVYLAVVEPLRFRAVQRWLERHHVLLPSSRAFVLPPGARSQRRPRATPPDGTPVVEDIPTDELHPGLIRALRTPGAFRGRAMRDDELLAGCRSLRELRPGDILVVPHLPERMALSLHRVAAPALVTGSSQTSALPLGIALDASWGLDGRLTTASPFGAHMWHRLPLPHGPLTLATQLAPLVCGWVASTPADRVRITPTSAPAPHGDSVSWSDADIARLRAHALHDRSTDEA